MLWGEGAESFLVFLLPRPGNGKETTTSLSLSFAKYIETEIIHFGLVIFPVESGTVLFGYFCIVLGACIISLSLIPFLGLTHAAEESLNTLGPPLMCLLLQAAGSVSWLI